MMDKQKIAAVFQYALSVVSKSEDPLSRKLGPIHLLKYAYLVDVEYARFHRGETFTGIEWKFHDFGPWSVAANALIAASLCVSGIRESFVPFVEKLPKQKRAELSARMLELRSRFQARHANARRAVVRERHDLDFAEAAAWVNSLAGPEFPEGENQVDFDSTVWKSEARRGHAVS